VTAITGLTIFHSIYVWPKLGGSALAIGAFVLYAQARPRGVPAMIGVAALAGLAWLAHGGTVFSLMALGVMGLLWRPWPSLRGVAAAALTFLLLAAPWTAYQKLYDPPGDRLVKWHLGGADTPDSRGTLQTIVDAYRAAGWTGTIANKRFSFLTLFSGWDEYTFTLDHPRERRIAEWYYFFRSFGVWNVALLAAPIVLLRRKVPAGFSAPMARATVIWAALSVSIWVLLLFGPPTWTVNHAGTLAAHMAVFALAFALAWRISPWFLAILAAISMATSAITWIPSTMELAAFPISSAAVAVSIVAALAICGVLAHAWRTHRVAQEPARPQTSGVWT
jgi:hypothetical protein